jgi:hypothetical protein
MSLQEIVSNKVSQVRLVHEALAKEKYFGFVNDDAREKILVFLSIEVMKANYFQGEKK